MKGNRVMQISKLLVMVGLGLLISQGLFWLPALAQDPDNSAFVLEGSSYDIASSSVAWGDYDNDGDLDLAVGGYLENKLYNNDDYLFNEVIWDPDDSERTTSVAWGDYDGDGWLDLAVGNDCGEKNSSCLPVRVYRNISGTLTANTVFTITDYLTSSTKAIAWGDYDGDGWLDLAVGSWGEPNRIYKNIRNSSESPPLRTLDGTAAWRTMESDYTGDLTWGYLDDGEGLDLAVANGCQQEGEVETCHPDRVYYNVGQTVTEAAVSSWTSTVTTFISGERATVALGDIDSQDGLELITSRGIYAISGTELLTTPTSWSVGYTPSLVRLGDYDSDGDLDLAIGGDDKPLQLYSMTKGRLSQELVWQSPETDDPEGVAWGDYDNDGDLDLVSANRGPIRLYRNQVGTLTAVSTHPLTVLEQPVDQISDVEKLVLLPAPSIFPDNTDFSRDETIVALKDWKKQIDGFQPLAPNNTYSGYDLANLFADFGTEGILLADLRGAGIPKWSSLSISPGYRLSGEMLNSSLVDTKYYIDNSIFESQGTESIGFNNRNDLLKDRFCVKSTCITHLAWGDYDNDGYVELAVSGGRPFVQKPFGVTTSYNYLYENENGGVWTPSRLSNDQENTHSLVWGDYDGDGDLDLAAGNDGSPNRLYCNQHGKLTDTALLDTDTVILNKADVLYTRTHSLAWGDYDNDGDLDLVVGNSGINQIYRNETSLSGDSGCGDAKFTAFNLSTEISATRSVAWGDYDGDGDLDLVVGNSSENLEAHGRQRNRIYRNDGLRDDKAPQFTQVDWQSEPDNTTSVAWGDYDGDGDLDLAVGNYAFPNQLYQNNAGQLANKPTWLTVEANKTMSVAWGDYDGDGDLDLLVGNYDSQADQIYQNNQGELSRHATWSSKAKKDTMTAAWADYDNDGDLDVASGYYTPTQNIALYENKRNSLGVSPQLHVARSAVPQANFYSTPQILERRITFTYTLSHPQRWPVQKVIGWYALQGGGKSSTDSQWKKVDNAKVDKGDTLLDTSPEGITYTFSWAVTQSDIFGQSDNVLFKLVAVPAIISQPNQVAGPYMYGAYGAETAPFRVRGHQIQVFSGTTVATGALVLKANANTHKFEPFTDLSGQPYQTDNQGYLQGRGTITIGDQLVALYPITWTDNYTLYYSNATPITTGVIAHAVDTLDTPLTITVGYTNPLYLFNLDVSLEWDTRNDPTDLARLKQNIHRASELLYDWSNGSIALGTITIHQAKANWTEADIIVYANDRVRPNADLGGITSPGTGKLDVISRTGQVYTYTNGQLRIGADWTRFGDKGDSSDEDWAAVLAFELGHYLLYLPDNYLGIDEGNIGYHACPGSAMTNPYQYSEFLDQPQWEANCKGTVADEATGRSDWETIKKFYPALRPIKTTRSTEAENGPTTLPLQVTQIQTTPIISTGEFLDNEFINLVDETNKVHVPRASRDIQAYLIKRQNTVTSADDYIVNLGAPTFNLIDIKGSEIGDQLCAFDVKANRTGCITLDESRVALPMPHVPMKNWLQELSIVPNARLTNTFNITLTLASPLVTESNRLHIQLFPDLNPDNQTSPSTTTATIQSQPTITLAVGLTDSIVADGYIRVQLHDPQEPYTYTTIVRLPAHAAWPYYCPAGRPCPPPRRGSNRIGGVQEHAPTLSPDGQVMVFDLDNLYSSELQYNIQELHLTRDLKHHLTPVGTAYRIIPTQAETSSILLYYREEDVPLGQEQWLNLYYQDQEKNWQRLPTTIEPQQNMIVATMQPEAGIYSLMSTVPAPLNEGWNNFGYVVPNTRPVTMTLASIEAVTSVYRYDSAQHEWLLFDKTVPLTLHDALTINTLTDFEFGHGYWVHVTQPITMYLDMGDLPNDYRNNKFFSSQTALHHSLPTPPAIYYGEIDGDDTEPTLEARLGDCHEPATIKPLDGSGRWGYVLQLKCQATISSTVEFYLNDELHDRQRWRNTHANHLDLSLAGR